MEGAVLAQHRPRCLWGGPVHQEPSQSWCGPWAEEPHGGCGRGTVSVVNAGRRHALSVPALFWRQIWNGPQGLVTA
ncbi:hypothetical protein NDU88_002041 [Pleurodeles waltl]|uniref:Uncharacterized protein n=1 Tax=Pleurodeles waltl TaxID=8319 RepID=A0AAV7L065_PLEWA|nr:hypothetical protein NDU88_002041 [Pleurodeles waltl]